MSKYIPFKHFEGLHELSGVDQSVTVVNGEDAATVLFELDGETYLAMENPEDGYRSSLDGIIKVRRKVKNKFPPVRVLVKAEVREDTDLLHFYRYKTPTKRLVMSIGTDNCDDYYPTFVGFFDPTALGRKKFHRGLTKARKKRPRMV